MDNNLGKWRAGTSYGPILSQTDLYLLHCEVELHPILLGKHSFHLNFSLVTGHTGGFNQESRDRDLPFVHKDEPATVPRVKQIVLITEHSPWCTIVTNETGVTLNDICVQVYKDYTTQITGAEYTSLQPRVQEQVKRISAHNQMSLSGWNNGGFYPGTPMATVNPDQLKRCDWLRERIYFEGLRKDDTYARGRLGYHASNIFLMDLAG